MVIKKNSYMAYLFLWSSSLLASSLLAAPVSTSKQGYLKQYFGPLCKKLQKKTAYLLVDGSQKYILTLLKDNYGITKGGQLNSSHMLEVEWQKKRFPAKLVSKDPINDLALVKVQTSMALPYFKLQGKLPFSIGSWAISLGPKGFLKGGVISAIHRNVRPNPRGGLLSIYGMLGLTGSGPKRSYKNVIQHDGPVETKYFGSPLINSQGELLGINISFAYRGTGFAISREYLQKIIPKLKKKGKKRAFLGVFLRETPKGLVIQNLYPGGPGMKGGLQKGDILLAIENQRFYKFQPLVKWLEKQRPGRVVKVKVLRKKKRMVFKILLGAKE